MFYVAIIGSEAAGTYERFKEKCIKILRTKAQEGITIVATEEHPYIEKFAKECRLNIQYFYTNWKAYGRDALKERNKQLVSNSSGLIYFDDKIKDNLMIKNLADKTGLPVRVIKKMGES
jgi:hypothetical protein